MAKQTLPAIKASIAALSLADIKNLQAYVTDLWLERLDDEWEPPQDENTIEVVKVGKVSYLCQKVKCGKKSCKCAKGDLHGPYWYGYQRQEGKVTKKYFGKARPAA